MVVLSVVLFGSIAFRRLPRNLMPDISYPSITVRTEYPGAAPVDVEKRVSRRLEEVLSQVRNLRRISSISRAEVSDVILEFTWDTAMGSATTDVREKVAQVVLPDEAERPTILRYDPTLDPILQIGLYRDESSRTDPGEELIALRLLAEDLVERELETVKGVAGVRVRGGLEREIRLEVDESKLRAKGLSIELLNRRLREENLNLASGIIYEGEQSRLVRTVNEFASVDEIREIILRRDGTVPVRVRDVASVELSYAEPEVVTRLDGKPCVKIDVYKEADANLVEVATAVRERIFGTDLERRRLDDFERRQREEAARITEGEPASSAEGRPAAGGPGGAPSLDRPRFLSARLPEGLGIRLMSDQSVFIENALSDVRGTVVLGGILAVVILYVFLRNGWFTLAVGLSIPLSVVAAFVAMYLFDVSLNMMSLGGLALGIGMLVDNSIVVLESIFRCREEGDAPRMAAVRGTRMVASAVTASTLTTVAVFFPIVFVEGVAGQIFRDQALTVVISLVASLATALYFIPAMVCRRFDRASSARARWSVPRLVSRTYRHRPLRDFAARLRGIRWASWTLPLRLVWVLLWDVPVLVGAWIRKWVSLSLLAPLVPLAWVSRRARSGAGGLHALIVARVFAWVDGLLSLVSRVYGRVLVASLRHRLVVVGVASLCGVGALQIFTRLDSELIPEVHQGEFTVDVRLPRATRIERTDEVLRPWERLLLDPAELPEIASLTTTIGVESDDVRAGDEGEHSARLLVRLEREGGTPEELELRAKSRIRELMKDAEFESVEFRNPVLFSFKTPIEVEVKGHDLGMLERLVEEIEGRLDEIAEIKDVKTNLARGAPEVQIRLDREALSRYGLTMAQVGEVVRRKLQGEVPTYFTLGDRKVPIRARLEEQDRDSLGELSDLIINPGAEKEYRLRDVVPQNAVPAGTAGERVLEIGAGPAEIRRIEHQRAAVVTANLAGMSLGTATEKVTAALSSVRHPPEFVVGFGGQKEEMDVASSSLRRALLLAIFLVFVVMAMQFESLVQPLVIILSIPLALVGVVPILWLCEIPLSIVVFIGLIVLAGIVVNNAIVLIDTANQLRRDGMPMDEALVRAGDVRLRPILMTTLTTVLGLLPLTGVLNGIPFVGELLGTGEGAEIRVPLAVTVVSGLTMSTLLTLIVIPVMASIVDSLIGSRATSAGLAPASGAAPSGAATVTEPGDER